MVLEARLELPRASFWHQIHPAHSQTMHNVVVFRQAARAGGFARMAIGGAQTSGGVDIVGTARGKGGHGGAHQGTGCHKRVLRLVRRGGGGAQTGR